MGNCQAAEAACVVVQQPGGKVERLYAPSTADNVMRGNPGHYVALVVLRVSGVHAGGAKQRQDPAIAAVAGKSGRAARITKVKLLKPKDALLFGQVYRLITSQEVAKAIQARRQDKTRRCEDTAAGDSTRRRPGHGSADGSQEGAAGNGPGGAEPASALHAAIRLCIRLLEAMRWATGLGFSWSAPLQPRLSSADASSSTSLVCLLLDAAQTFVFSCRCVTQEPTRQGEGLDTNA